MKQSFSIDALGQVDGGKVSRAIDLAIRSVTQDCCDRPGDDRARKVLVTIDLTPQPDEYGVCESAALQFHIKTAVPARRSRVVQMATNANGALEWNPASEDNIRQRTLDEGGD